MIPTPAWHRAGFLRQRWNGWTGPWGGKASAQRLETIPDGDPSKYSWSIMKKFTRGFIIDNHLELMQVLDKYRIG
ncbi:hypothetical protein [Proteiniclasticum sp. QWL-01]|uniref:hypothetical protein n=1 Tax=Proteiniclasticum sp. QWL-01 TaxID=3036945 RepID=UPI00240FBE0B|nr:hypothetical protein [Proteiniclasticum sp. QWL-01]WFF72898.1 hypothetical protein P6M73_00020 [Proteiniclasticum sp. QWL-01]